MTSKDQKANKDIRDINKDLDKQDKNKENKVKKFITKPIVIVILTILAVILTAWATLTLKAEFDNYNQNLIEQGVQLEKDRKAAIEKEIAARSKTTEQ